MNEDIYLNWSDRQSDWERLAKRVARLEVDMKESLQRIEQRIEDLSRAHIGHAWLSEGGGSGTVGLPQQDQGGPGGESALSLGGGPHPHK